MEEDIYKIIIENSGINLIDMSLLNPRKLSKIITSNFMGFIEWRNEQSVNLEYFTFEKIYDYWKNNIRK